MKELRWTDSENAQRHPHIALLSVRHWAMWHGFASRDPTTDLRRIKIHADDVRFRQKRIQHLLLLILLNFYSFSAPLRAARPDFADPNCRADN